MEWQPISSAPPHGHRVLLWWPYWAAWPLVGWFETGKGWQATAHVLGVTPLYNGPTHWMPLPEPPKD